MDSDDAGQAARPAAPFRAIMIAHRRVHRPVSRPHVHRAPARGTRLVDERLHHRRRHQIGLVLEHHRSVEQVPGTDVDDAVARVVLTIGEPRLPCAPERRGACQARAQIVGDDEAGRSDSLVEDVAGIGGSTDEEPFAGRHHARAKIGSQAHVRRGQVGRRQARRCEVDDGIRRGQVGCRSGAAVAATRRVVGATDGVTRSASSSDGDETEDRGCQDSKYGARR